MQIKRLVFNIIAIVTSFLASLVFLAPVWYFDNSMTIDKTTTNISTNTVNVFDYHKLGDIQTIYNNYGKNLDTTLATIFLILASITIALSLAFSILNIMVIVKKYSHTKKLLLTSKILAILMLTFSLIALTIAIIFCFKSKETIITTDDLTNSISMNISTGIYLFIVFEIAGGVCGYIANTIKTKEE